MLYQIKGKNLQNQVYMLTIIRPEKNARNINHKIHKRAVLFFPFLYKGLCFTSNVTNGLKQSACC